MGDVSGGPGLRVRRSRKAAIMSGFISVTALLGVVQPGRPCYDRQAAEDQQPVPAAVSRLTLCAVDRQTGAASSRAKVRAWHTSSFL